MRARSLGLMIGGVSLLGGSLAIVLSACGGNDSATHGFVYDGGSGNPPASDDDDDDDDTGDMDATTSDASRDGSSGDAGKLDGSGGSDAAKLDAAPGKDAAPPVDSGPAPTGLHCDGTVYAGEYGDATHQYLNTTSQQTWYMAWDQTNVYLAITNATTTEAAVMYWNFGGTTGPTVGFGYDDVTPSQLPFHADTIMYFKNGYNDYRLAMGSSWAAAPSLDAANYKVCLSTDGTTREVVIPWSDLASPAGGTQPGTFNFLGYLESPAGYLYGMAPGDNPGALDAGGVPWPHYFNVANSGFGGNSPFSTESHNP